MRGGSGGGAGGRGGVEVGSPSPFTPGGLEFREGNGNMDSDRAFLADVRRALVLGAYMHAWGMPRDRVVSTKGPTTVEVYSFPGHSADEVTRFATFGVLSALGELRRVEFLAVLPSDLAGASVREVALMMLGAVEAVAAIDERVSLVGTTFESFDMPAVWGTRAILLDEPRGEVESISTIAVGGGEFVEVLWVVPIHAAELDLIAREGLGAFDELVQAAEWSLAEPRRDPLVAA